MCFYVLKPTVVILVQVCCIFYHTYVIPFKCSTIWMRFYSFKDAVTQKPKHRRKSLSKIQQQCYTLLHFLPLYLDSACSTKGLREPWQHLSLSFSFSLPHHKLIIIICLRFTFACVWQGLCPCQMCHKSRLNWNGSTHDSVYDHQLSERTHVSRNAFIQPYFTYHYERQKN